jgi:hypothetical protein
MLTFEKKWLVSSKNYGFVYLKFCGQTVGTICITPGKLTCMFGDDAEYGYISTVHTSEDSVENRLVEAQREMVVAFYKVVDSLDRCPVPKVEVVGKYK